MLADAPTIGGSRPAASGRGGGSSASRRRSATRISGSGAPSGVAGRGCCPSAFNTSAWSRRNTPWRWLDVQPDDRAGTRQPRRSESSASEVVPDEVLVRRWQRGDLSRTSIAIQRHERVVFGAALRLLRHPADAEDAAQETFLPAQERIGGLREGAALSYPRRALGAVVSTLQRAWAAVDSARPETGRVGLGPHGHAARAGQTGAAISVARGYGGRAPRRVPRCATQRMRLLRQPSGRE